MARTYPRLSRTTVSVGAIVLFALVAIRTYAQPAQPKLMIPDEAMPPFNVGVEVRIPLHATGGTAPYLWLLAAGELPPGIALDPSGFLVGRPQKAGPYTFTLTVNDSARPANSINKDFNTQVTAALLLEWLDPPAIHDNQISGTAKVSNGTKDDDFDLTVIVVAVNEIGRATALGYQHVTLKAGVTDFEIPFGSTMPPGQYVVHADAVAEIPKKNNILRERLQTPVMPLVQGP